LQTPWEGLLFPARGDIQSISASCHETTTAALPERIGFCTVTMGDWKGCDALFMSCTQSGNSNLDRLRSGRSCG